MIRSPECLYIWNEVIVIELSTVSNGWFRYLMNETLATMYSSGSTESGSDPADGKAEFYDKIRIASIQVPPDVLPRPVLSSPAPDVKLIVGNWALSCQVEGELMVLNSEGVKVVN